MSDMDDDMYEEDDYDLVSIESNFGAAHDIDV